MNAGQLAVHSRLGGLSRSRRWIATLAATAASTYALDAVATAAGVALAAVGVVQLLGHELVLVFVALTYVAWGFGLRANLPANWRLLEQTGTSTNALSKGAHDLLRARGASTRATKLASAAGYVSTELAKEVPYYVGAFGAAVVSDSVSANDALVFLGGANLGAAAYELTLARLTGAVLGRYASFEADWEPKVYLADYYAEVEPDERETIAYFVEAMRCVEPGQPVLLFGVGPTLHHVFLAAGHASEIHLADYLPANLDEIRRWLDHEPDAHDWRSFVRYTLECEGVAHPTETDVTCREELTRARIAKLLHGDAGRPEPVGDRYATVISAYCADSATADRATWETYMRHIAGRVQPGGTFVTAALRHCRGYVVGDKRFPSADVDEQDLRDALASRFDTSVEVRELEGHEAQGYTGIVLAHATCRG